MGWDGPRAACSSSPRQLVCSLPLVLACIWVFACSAISWCWTGKGTRNATIRQNAITRTLDKRRKQSRGDVKEQAHVRCSNDHLSLPNSRPLFFCFVVYVADPSASGSRAARGDRSRSAAAVGERRGGALTVAPLRRGAALGGHSWTPKDNTKTETNSAV